MDISSSYTMTDCARFKAERDALAQRMEEIASEIDRTLSGVEGIEDAPAIRWMRGLREALGSLHSPRISCEDIEAAKWVRGQGGIDIVKARWRDLIVFADAVCKKAVPVQRRATGLDDRTMSKALEALDERLMPRGMEWPRFEDDAPVRIGDVATLADNEPHEVESIEFFADKSCKLKGKGTPWMNTIFKGQIAMRPAPKVLDADGVEIRAGDNVYGFSGQQYEVTGLCEWEPSIVHAKTVGDGVAADELIAMSGQLNSVQLDASKLTHRAPVIAADGKPLREGETVYEVDGTGHAYEVVSIRIGDGNPLTPTVVTCDEGDGTSEHFLPSQLIHERPESKCRDCAHWQKDPTADTMGVCWFYYHEHEGQDCYAARRGDIGACEEFMPRAEALAGVE